MKIVTFISDGLIIFCENKIKRLRKKVFFFKENVKKTLVRTKIVKVITSYFWMNSYSKEDRVIVFPLLCLLWGKCIG